MKTYLLIFFTFILQGTGNAFSIDSLLYELKSPPKNSLDIIRINSKIANNFFEKENYEQAIFYYKKALSADRAKNHSEYYFKNLYQLGESYRRTTQYDNALSCFSLLKEEKNHLPENEYLAYAHNKIGAIYQALGDYDKAYQSQIQALKIHETQRDTQGMSVDYYVIGSIFFYQKNYQQALENYEQSRILSEKIENPRGLYNSLAALGSAYAAMENWEKGWSYGDKALQLAQTMNYQTGIAYSLGNLAFIKNSNNEFTEGNKLLKKSIQLKQQVNDKWGTIGGFLSLSNSLIRNEKLEAAQTYVDSALVIAQEIGSRPRIMECYENFVNIYKAKKDFDAAYFYLEKFVALKDTVLNEKTLAEMGQAQKRYELEKKENEITLLQSQNDLFEKNEIIQTQQRTFFLILIIGLLISCWIFFSRLKIQKTSNHLLEEKNEEIQIQNQLLRDTQNQLVESNLLLEEKNQLLGRQKQEIEQKNKLLQASNEDLQNFAYVASHDLKEPLRMIGSYTALLKRRYSQHFDETANEFMFFVVDGVDRMKVMLDDLLSYSRVGTEKSFEDKIDLEDILFLVENNLTPRIQEQNAILHIHKKNLPIIKGSHTQLTQLLQNLISNAIKFKGSNDPEVIIDCKKESDQYILSIQDNGIGISKENQKKVFEMFKRLHTKEEYEGTGIGLATCKKIVDKHGGSIWIESELGKGSTFFIAFPVPEEVPQSTIETV